MPYPAHQRVNRTHWQKECGSLDRASIDAPGAVGGRCATQQPRLAYSGWLLPATSLQTQEAAVGAMRRMYSHSQWLNVFAMIDR